MDFDFFTLSILVTYSVGFLFFCSADIVAVDKMGRQKEAGDLLLDSLEDIGVPRSQIPWWFTNCAQDLAMLAIALVWPGILMAMLIQDYF